jgi:hypothetical protein
MTQEQVGLKISRERQIAESYRLRAEELRIMAGMDRHAVTREALERDYESMAGAMGDIAITKETIQRH